MIAERVLVRADDQREHLLVTLMKPEYKPESGNFECGYRITGTGVEIARAAWGQDSFQALQLAMFIIGAEVEALERKLGVRWCFGDGGDSGLAISIP